MSLALSLCQYVLRPRLEAPRLQALETRDLLHQHKRKGKVVMIKTRRCKRLVFRFVFCTWNWYDFWRRSWGLPCSRPLLPTWCWFVWRWCVSTLEQYAAEEIKTGPSRRHRIQPAEGPFLDPRAKETSFKKGSESGPTWNQKRSPLEGPVLVPFWPLHSGKSVGAFISSWSWFEQQKLRLESWTGEAYFCAPAFSYVLRSKKGPLLSYCFAPISI